MTEITGERSRAREPAELELSGGEGETASCEQSAYRGLQRSQQCSKAPLDQ